jgi:hypothetical protein
MGQDYFEYLHQRYEKARGVLRIIVKEFQDADDPMKSLIMNYPRMPNLNLDISFISIRRNARRMPLHERAQSYRMSIIPPDPFDPNETWEAAVKEGLRTEQDRESGHWISRRMIERSVR